MTKKLASRAEVASLVPLVEKSNLLDIKRGQVVAKDRLPVPTNEYGLPKPRELIVSVLGTVATEHYWGANHDVHHVVWPARNYKKNEHDDELLGPKYRGSASLKIRPPRQLHNYVHKITEPPQRPPEDVMRQYVLEQHQIYRLYDTIKPSSLCLVEASLEQKESIRLESFRQKLGEMQPGELGLMPDINMLYSLELSEVRQIVRSLARVQGFSNSRKSLKSIYKKDFSKAA